MNENINLCEILKGCEGVELYSTIHGIVKFKGIGLNLEYPVMITFKNGANADYTKEGRFLSNLGECVLFPLKDQRDWNKFQRPIPVDTPMMCSNNKLDWSLRYYKRFKNGVHHVTVNGYKSNENHTITVFNKIIPFDKFNPNDIEESLKYNIQK